MSLRRGPWFSSAAALAWKTRTNLEGSLWAPETGPEWSDILGKCRRIHSVPTGLTYERAVACPVKTRGVFEAIVYNVWFGGAESCLSRGLV